jgi:2OG-Fe(II) oxygenase superfamily
VGDFAGQACVPAPDLSVSDDGAAQTFTEVEIGKVVRPANEQDEAVIPVLSLGATRRFLIRPAGGGPSTAIVTHGGDLVVMGGRCQQDYQHSVPKQKQSAGARLSLNFSLAVPAR